MLVRCRTDEGKGLHNFGWRWISFFHSCSTKKEIIDVFTFSVTFFTRNFLRSYTLWLKFVTELAHILGHPSRTKDTQGIGRIAQKWSLPDVGGGIFSLAWLGFRTL